MTKTEWKLLGFYLCVVLAYAALFAFLIYNFTVHWILGWLNLIPLLPAYIWIFSSNQFYIPIRRNYFRCFFRTHSKEERKEFDREISSGECLCLGKAVFLKDYIFIRDKGILLERREVCAISKKIFHPERPNSRYGQSYCINLIFYCRNKPKRQKYTFWCYPNLYAGFEENYRKVSERIHTPE